jgi:hypothetical protein
MRNRFLRTFTALTLFAALSAATALGVSMIRQRQGAAPSPAADKKERSKSLKEVAHEQDVSVSFADSSESEYKSFEPMKEEAVAIVHGRIVNAASAFDETGDAITTEYQVQVLRVLKDVTSAAAPAPGQTFPAPLKTPLKIARDGGVVNVNGHRAEVRLKGQEALRPGEQYVFFLFWSSPYQAYTLAGGISGVVAVKDDLTVQPLASSKAMQQRFAGASLEKFVNELLGTR